KLIHARQVLPCWRYAMPGTPSSTPRSPAPPVRTPQGGAKGERPKDGDTAPAWPPGRMWLIFLIVLGINFGVTRLLALGEAEAPITVPYTVFKQQVTKDNVESIYSRGEDIEGRFAKAVTWPEPNAPAAAGTKPGAKKVEPRTGSTFKTTLPTFVGPG